MPQEITFNKYKQRGADYHYKQINKLNLFTFNSFVYARYMKHVSLVKRYISNNIVKTSTIKILDVGCGDGVLLYLIKKNTPNLNIEYYGIDSSSEALKIAQQKMPNAQFKKTDVYDLTYKDDYFDIIISSDVIEHVNHPERMLKEIQRVAKKSAFVAIGTPIRYTHKPLDLQHFQEFYEKDFLDLMQRHFNDSRLFKSHDLMFTLLYQKSLHIFKYHLPLSRIILNLLNICFGVNFFLKNSPLENTTYAYMFVISKNNAS